jgi:uncharacterized membrane protein YphA (DoxX/SURF4 family)
MKRIFEAMLFILLICLTSMIWIMIHWPYSPEAAIADMGKLGAIGFVLDILFIGMLIRWFKPKKSND